MNFIDLKTQYSLISDKVAKGMAKICASTSFVLGEDVDKLEKTLADYVGVNHAIACGSGTDALLISLMAQGVKAGDEIITTPFTFVATAQVISQLGAIPVFIDIKPKTFNINPALIEEKITKRTKGVIAVDLFGQCAEYLKISRICKKHKLFLIEDAAQSFGASRFGQRAGSFGDVACVSFFPSKPLGAYGDGGMIFTDDLKMAEMLRSVAVHGKGKNGEFLRVGLNSRLDTLQAMIIFEKFCIFEDELKLREKVAKRYDDGLKDIVKIPYIIKDNYSVYAQYSIMVPKDRDGLVKYLSEQEIPTGVYYALPLYNQPLFNKTPVKLEEFQNTEKVSKCILSLPMHPYLEKKDQDFIINHIKKYYNEKS